jgi:O-antigen/teichoic acid export membrane protein
VSPRPDAAGPPTGPTSEATAEALDAASTLGGLAPERPTYGASARILGIGIAITGVVTFGYFAVASYVLTPAQYGRIALLWSILFVTMSVIYRPVEQLLSRAIARRRAIDPGGSDQLKRPALIQLSFAAAFLIVSLIFRGPIQDGLFDGSTALYWILVGSGLAYAASYFARGFLAGHQWFELYGGLVLFEAITRILFPIGVALGMATGQTAVALGILAAPFASLLVIPWAFARRRRHEAEAAPVKAASSGKEDAGFAGSVAVIQLSEQTLLNAAVLLIATPATAGIVFSALLIARAPLQLFQAIQTSLLPHLAGSDDLEAKRAVRVTLLAILGFTGAVAAGLVLIGPFVMDHVFDSDYEYDRFGLMLIAIAMGLHLAAGTLNQLALARDQSKQAAATWAFAAVVFVAWMAVDIVSDELWRTEIGYAGAAALLVVMLAVLTRGKLAPTPPPP